MGRQVCHPGTMFDDILDANRQFAADFRRGAMAAATQRHLAVVTCMDTRIDPLPVLGLQVGDAKVVRNAGGRVTDDVIRSLVLATTYLAVDRIAVMHHTRCALAGQTEEEALAGIPTERRVGAAAGPMLAMPDPDAALAEDVRALREHAAIGPVATIEGWRYDVDTGLVHRIVPA